MLGEEVQIWSPVPEVTLDHYWSKGRERIESDRNGLRQVINKCQKLHN